MVFNKNIADIAQCISTFWHLSTKPFKKRIDLRTRELWAELDSNWLLIVLPKIKYLLHLKYS